MQVISLFSGIGGFELAAEWMGWDNILSCEINPFGRKILSHYWPNSYHHDDIKTLTIETLKKTRWNPSADSIICGGFPCQPYSLAGKRKGKEDERHLWPEMLRVIKQVRPRYIVGENVFGLVNWNGGMVFDEVQAQLEAAGYEVGAYVLPACAVNAPHRRDRVWFIAHRNNAGAYHNSGINGERQAENQGRQEQPQFESWQSSSDGSAKNTHGDGWECNQRQSSPSIGKQWHTSTGNNEPIPTHYAEIGDATNTTGEGLEGREWRSSKGERFTSNSENIPTHPTSERLEGENNSQPQKRIIARYSQPNSWQNFPTQPPICGGDDGLPPRLDGITFPKWRNESIKAYGNAIVPQVAYQIFKAIKEAENKK